MLIEFGSCINSKTAFVQGTQVFKEQAKTVSVSLREEINDWDIIMFYSYKIFDSQDPDEPVKTQIFWQESWRQESYSFELSLHQLELQDNIYSPFKKSENISYLTLKESDSI